MRIFLAGATGVIGRRLVPLLATEGHEVAGMTRSEANAGLIREAGGEPVVCDVYETDALGAAVEAFSPDLVLHQLTDLPDDPSQMAQHAEASHRMYREGTPNLIEAAGTARLAAQSIAWKIPGEMGDAISAHEEAVGEAGGLVIRYGRFYGPGTYFEDEPPPDPRIHVDDAARRTLALLDEDGGFVEVSEPVS